PYTTRFRSGGGGARGRSGRILGSGAGVPSSWRRRMSLLIAAARKATSNGSWQRRSTQYAGVDGESARRALQVRLLAARACGVGAACGVPAGARRALGLGVADAAALEFCR